MTQEQRLDYLLKHFRAGPGEWTGGNTLEKRHALRALMNVRMPADTDPDTLKVQDEYLTERAREKGIVSPDDIPRTRDPRLSVWQGDITRLAADAIVNAANSQMLGCFIPLHTCIDNCIHTFAGVQLRSECARQMRRLRARYGPDYEQPDAVPMLTDAYNLPAKKIVHIVGPVVSGALTQAHERTLADCYRNTLDLCAENGLKTVAFCCISTGVFHFPADRAAEIAVETVTGWLDAHGTEVEHVIFNVFGDRDRILYERLLAR